MKNGHSFLSNTTSSSNTQTSHSTYDTVQMQAYQESPEHTPHLIAHPSMYIPPPLTKSSLENLKKGDTLAPSPVQKLNSKSAPFKPHRYPWFQRQESQTSFVSSKTCLSHEITQPCTPSITPWTQTLFHVPGEHSPQSALSLTVFPPIRKEHAATSPKPIASYRWPQINGQEWWYNFPSLTHLESTNATHLAAQLRVVSSVSSQTHCPTSFEQRALAPRANGWTTKSSFGSPTFTSMSTIRQGQTSRRSLQRQVDGNSKEAGYGLAEVPDRMDELRNLTKTCHSPYETWPKAGTMATPTTYRTLITSPINWASPGNAPRTLTSVRLFPSLASFGILRKGQSRCGQRKRTNTSARSRNGKSQGRTPWERFRNSTGNYVTPPWLPHQPGGHARSIS